MTYKKVKIPQLEHQLRELFAARQSNSVKELARMLEQALCDKIKETFAPWHKQQEQKLHQEFSELAARLSARANDVIDQIYETAGELFHLHIQKYDQEERLTAEKYFYFKVGGETSALEPFENLPTYSMAAL